MTVYLTRAPVLAVLSVFAPVAVATAAAADSSTPALAVPLESYITLEASGDSSGGQNYKVDIDHALASRNRLLLAATRSVVSTATGRFFGTALQIGFATDSTERWSHSGTYEFAALGKNIDSHDLAYSLNWNTDRWGIRVAPEIGRIGVFGGSPSTRVDIDRVGLNIDINHYTDGPWRFLFSAAANNFYGDASSIPTLILIVRYTSAGLFISNFYKSRYGAEAGYNLDHGSVAFGIEQALVGSSTTNSLYLSVDGNVSDSLSVRAEIGRSYAAITGRYVAIGISYKY